VAEMAWELGGVEVVIAGGLLVDPDHVGAELAVSGVGDTQVAVFHEAAQSGRVHRVLGPAGAEALRGLAHGVSSSLAHAGPPRRATRARDRPGLRSVPQPRARGPALRWRVGRGG